MIVAKAEIAQDEFRSGSDEVGGAVRAAIVDYQHDDFLRQCLGRSRSQVREQLVEGGAQSSCFVVRRENNPKRLSHVAQCSVSTPVQC
jgi:hypothetical protein